MSKSNNFLFSQFFKDLNRTQKIVYIGVFTALSVVCNLFFEFKMNDVQFSITIAIGIVIGIIFGSVIGFSISFIGDLIGVLLTGYLYMPWVGLSTATFSLIAGLIVHGISFKFKGQIYVKLAIVFLLTFLICTIGINSTGFYIYNYRMGFSTAVINYVSEKFDSDVTFIFYVFYRLIFKGQIFNSLFNYALVLLLITPLIKVMEKLSKNNQ